MSVALAAPAFAQDAMAMDQTCEEFSAMDADGQMKTAEMLNMEMADAAKKDGKETVATTADDTTEMVMKACDAYPDMKVGEAIMKMNKGG